MTNLNHTTVHFSLPNEWKRRVDQWAKLVGSGRSEFIRAALRHYITYLSNEGADESLRGPKS